MRELIQETIEREFTAGLRVALFHVAQSFDHELTGHFFVVRKQILLGLHTQMVDQAVGIGRQSGDSTRHIATSKKQ